MPTQKSKTNYALKNALALKKIAQIGDNLAKNLVSYCGGIDAVFKEKKVALSKIPGIGLLRAESIIKFNDWDIIDQEIRFTEKYNIDIITYLDASYPYRLKAHSDSPFLLFKKGNADLNAARMISIVGTRNMSNYGKESIQQLVNDLATYKASIISGLALGVDTQAHKDALLHKLPTIGVLGHGFSTFYPAQNKKLAEEMIRTDGALITDYFSFVPGNPENFPSRNRIVASLCDALIVIESAHSGGSMITAELANSYDKLTFAIPGNTYQKYSQGCNLLIKLNKANLYDNIGDIIYHLNWDKQPIEQKHQISLFEELSNDEKTVLAALNKAGVPIDEIYYQTKIAMSKLSLILLDLELKNVVKVLPGKKFAIAARY